MSKKDVEKYYNQITEDYKEMLDTLKEMEDLAANDIVNPDKVEEIRAAVEPLKFNYQAISWIMFLLNSPNKDNKKERYKKFSDKQMSKIDPDMDRCPEKIRAENKQVIESVNKIWKGDLDE